MLGISVHQQLLTAYQELNNIPGKSLSDNHALSIFLKGIADPDYEKNAQIKRNKSGGLDDTTVTLRKKKRVLISKRTERKKLRANNNFSIGVNVKKISKQNIDY